MLLLVAALVVPVGDAGAQLSIHDPDLAKKWRLKTTIPVPQAYFDDIRNGTWITGLGHNKGQSIDCIWARAKVDEFIEQDSIFLAEATAIGPLGEYLQEHMALIDTRAIRSDQPGSIVHEAMHHAGVRNEDRAEAAADCMQEGDPQITRKLNIPEHWAKWWAKIDHCALEERNLRETGYKPPPWESYCHNPRPLMTGTINAETSAKESQRLKREWDERHGLAPTESDSK